MINFFSKFKDTSLNVINIFLSSSLLLYMISIHGFSHIDKVMIKNLFAISSFLVIGLAIFSIILSFVLYASFNIAMKKVGNQFESFKDDIKKTSNL